MQNQSSQQFAGPAGQNVSVLTFKGAAYPWQMDHMGHLNVQHYVGLFDQSNWNFAAAIGLDREFMTRQGVGLAALEQTIHYKREVMPGETLEIHAAVTNIARKTFVTQHVMTTHNGTVAADMYLTVIYLDTQARKGLPLPEEVVAALARHRLSS